MKVANRQRTKCFTGCWTCRSRRVKCDETTPLCQRCSQFGVQCEGYGVRLSWVQYDPRENETGSHVGDGDNEEEQATTTNSRLSRRAPRVSAIPRLSSPELDVTLSKIDDWSLGESEGVEHKGFSVFPSDWYGRVHAVSPSPAPTVVAVFDEGNDMNDAPFQHLSDPTKETIAFSATHSLDQVAVAEHQIASDTDLPIAQTLLSLGSNCDGFVQAPFQPQQEQLQQHHSPPRHLDVLFLPANQKRLIHHWVTFTSRKLVLLDEPHNPCRTMMLPMALKGLVSSSQGSNADIAIFHALCASSAYNLFELGGRTSEQDRALALNHDQVAIHHLGRNLARADEHQDESFAMAIMACIAVEAISGKTKRWRTHVSGGLAYLAKLQTRGLDEVVLSPFRCYMLSMAVLCDVLIPVDLRSFLNDDGLPDGLEFTFPYYGVSKSFLLAHNRMNEYAAAAAISSSKSASLEQELDAFELQLYLDFPRLLPREQAGLVSNRHGAVIHHTAETFYYAGLVFFQRSIRGATVEAVQSLVELGIGELESIDRAGKGELGCMMLWPVLVLGAECGTDEVQRRMRSWFQSQRKLGFRNLVVLEDLVATVWKSRADSASKPYRRDVDWQELIVETQFDVFRL